MTQRTKFADKREIEGLVKREPIKPIDEPELWIDYVADVGDGWNSTYTIAWLITEDPSDLVAVNGSLGVTKRGRILVLGGDAVYPRASHGAYETRLLGPYRAATAGEPLGARSVYAIPGNHDWYDGLTSFMRLFCRNGRFATWTAPQERSYFAVRLPGNWWLLGIDIAFDAYIDEAQLAYFRDLRCPNEDERHSLDACQPDQHCEDRTKLHCGDRIILCTAKPGWEEAVLSGDFHTIGQSLGRRALHEFETEITKATDLENEDGVKNGWGCELKLLLSGDLHHYAHYESKREGEPHRITAGGGGAFFFPTHATAKTVTWPSESMDETDQVTYERSKTYPDPGTSKRWRWLIPFAPVFANPSFAVAVGVIYLLLGLVAPDTFRLGNQSIIEAIRLQGFWRFWFPPTARPLFVILAALIFLALRAFADAKTKPGRTLLMALPHWLVHMYALTVAIAISQAAGQHWAAQWADEKGAGQLWYVGAVALPLFLVGALIGGCLMGFYLLIAQLFGRHPGEAFAAMHLSGYKNFLRLHVDDGGLTVYAFGVRSACKHWSDDSYTEGRPTPVECPAVDLIERITIA